VTIKRCLILRSLFQLFLCNFVEKGPLWHYLVAVICMDRLWAEKRKINSLNVLSISSIERRKCTSGPACQHIYLG
jgi:hypothetical protein